MKTYFAAALLSLGAAAQVCYFNAYKAEESRFVLITIIVFGLMCFLGAIKLIRKP